MTALVLSVQCMITKIIDLSMECLECFLLISKWLVSNHCLSSDEFENFRPISKSSFSAKVVEKCVAKQLIDYLDANDLNVIYQSAHKKLHST